MLNQPAISKRADAIDVWRRASARGKRVYGRDGQVLPWKAMLALIVQCYPTGARPGRQPNALKTLLRIHFFSSGIP